jgi:hypothetical protein
LLSEFAVSDVSRLQRLSSELSDLAYFGARGILSASPTDRGAGEEGESRLIPLPQWMRYALYATAVMNVMAAAALLPAARPVRVLAGLPEDAQPLYVATVAMFVFLFGLAYFWTAITGRSDRVFIALAAAGKFSFFALLLGFWAAGSLPARVPVLGSLDLFFSVLFARWLFSTAR